MPFLDFPSIDATDGEHRRRRNVSLVSGISIEKAVAWQWRNIAAVIGSAIGRPIRSLESRLPQRVQA
jgi:hypothetical protein